MNEWLCIFKSHQTAYNCTWFQAQMKVANLICPLNFSKLDLEWTGIGSGEHHFCNIVLREINFNWLELELTKWDWPHVCHVLTTSTHSLNYKPVSQPGCLIVTVSAVNEYIMLSGMGHAWEQCMLQCRDNIRWLCAAVLEQGCVVCMCMCQHTNTAVLEHMLDVPTYKYAKASWDSHGHLTAYTDCT